MDLMRYHPQGTCGSSSAVQPGHGLGAAPSTSGGQILGFRLGLLAAVAAVSMLINSAAVDATGDIAALAAQRQALQAQANVVLGSRDSTMAELLLTRDRLGLLRGRLERNAVALAALDRQQSNLRADVARTEARIQLKKDLLSGLVRSQYKTRANSNLSEILFDSSNLSQVVDRIVATETIGKRAHTIIDELRSQEARLAVESSALEVKQAEAGLLQVALKQQREQVQALAADYQSQLSSLDASAHALLAQIKQVDAAIAAASLPPGGGGRYTQQQIVSIIRTAAARYGANGDQMVRVAQCESGLNPRAYDPYSGASGLFQFMPGTFYGHGGHDIWDPTDQSNVAAQMFAHGQSSAWTCR
jgi:peptidoglycan hydrolase CwlO-like protein